MSEFSVTFDGKAVRASGGTTILEAARSAGVTIPTLCHHERLVPFGGCRLCIVEAEGRAGPRLVASCVHPIEEDLVVRTRSPTVDRMRKLLLELLLAHAPDSPLLQELAREYGADKGRFERQASFCIHCGLCVRYCAEVEQKHVVGFIDRGPHKEICFIPELSARECPSCMRCFPLCPTSYLQAAYVLTRSLGASRAP
jgi:NADH dehydrogenase/NADH:ubiquinone oxidoreductase subunit G